MQMAKSKLYRMPLSTKVVSIDIKKELAKMAKVCAGCSMRHIFKPEEELVELDQDGIELTSYHINCAPSHAVATPMQFIRAGYDKERAQVLADRANDRKFALREELERSVMVDEPINLEVS